MKKFLLGVILFAIAASSFSAENVKVFNGRGLVGVFGNYYKTNTGRTLSARLDSTPYVSLTNYKTTYSVCTHHGLGEIDGVTGMRISNDLILVPEFTFVDKRSTDYAGNHVIDYVTGHFNGWGSATNQFPNAKLFCMWAPLQTSPKTEMIHHVTMTGRLLVYGTGNQKSGQYKLNYDIGFSIHDFRTENEGAWVQLVAQSNPINVVVSGLTCSLQTDSKVNFGIQDANAAANTKLLTVQRPVSIYCSQLADQTNASIGIAAGIPPQYYAGTEYDVNLLDSSNQAAAYVKVFVNHNGNRQPLALNRVMHPLESIKANQKEIYVNSTLDYELYSRGVGATGKVTGAYELSVVMR